MRLDVDGLLRAEADDLAVLAGAVDVILAAVVLDEDERLAVTRVAARVEVHAGARAGEDLGVVRARDRPSCLLVLADLSALEKEVVVPVDFSEADEALAAAFAAVIPWRSDVSTRIGLISPSAIRPDTFSPVIKMTSSAWFIDAINVIGSRPDGWWRDREGAARRLIDEVRAWADERRHRRPGRRAGRPARARDGGVTVVRAPRRGRDAADDEIVRLVDGRDDARVVTSRRRRSPRACAHWAPRSRARATFRRRLASPR